MHKNKENVPKIRFPGFEGPWEQRKLEEIADIISGGTPSTSNAEYWDGDINWYSPAEIGDEIYAYESQRKITSLGLEKSSAKVLPAEKTILFSSRAGIGSMAILKAPAATNQGFQSLVLRNGNDTYFVYSMGALIKQYAEKVASGSTFLEISGKVLGNMNILVPSGNEQKQIGAFFSKIDNLITLHQRKLEHLQDKKKGLLQKMFPKEGEKFPELRFPGFTDPWEQRKLETVATFSKGRGYSKGDLREEGTPIILYGRLYTKYETCISKIDTFVEAKDDSVYSKGGEVIVPASGETAEDIARAASVEKTGVVLGGDLNVLMPNEDINSSFLALSISNGIPQKDLAKRAQGKSVVHVHNEDIKELNIYFPELLEQVKISAYFKQLDNLITLNQRKLEHLQQQKKGLLQQMFV